MFKAYDQSNHLLGNFKDFETAMKTARRHFVTDDENLQYFGDGTGTGFSALKQSNKGTLHESWPIYNQKTRYLKSIKAVSWHIFWRTGSIKAVKNYHNRVREMLKIGTLKLKTET